MSQPKDLALKPCPGCGKDNLPEATQCWMCSHPLRAPARVFEPPANTPRTLERMDPFVRLSWPARLLIGVGMLLLVILVGQFSREWGGILLVVFVPAWIYTWFLRLTARVQGYDGGSDGEPVPVSFLGVLAAWLRTLFNSLLIFGIVITVMTVGFVLFLIILLTKLFS